MDILEQRQSIIDTVTNSPIGSTDLMSAGIKHVVTLEQSIIENLIQKSGSTETSTVPVDTDPSIISLFNVETSQWISLPVQSITDVQWSQPPNGLLPWETLDEKVFMSHGALSLGHTPGVLNY